MKDVLYSIYCLAVVLFIAAWCKLGLPNGWGVRSIWQKKQKK